MHTLRSRKVSPTEGGNGHNVPLLQLTDKLYGLLEVGADVCHVAVLHWDPLVVIVALGRLQVPA